MSAPTLNIPWLYYILWNLQCAKVQSEKWGAGVTTEKSGTLPCVNWAWIKHKVDIIESGNFYNVKCGNYVQSWILLRT